MSLQTPAITESGAVPPLGARGAGRRSGVRSSEPLDTVETAAEVPRIDHILEAILYVLLAYLPLAFGGVMPMSRVVIIAASSLLAAVFAVRCITESRAPVVLSRAFLPLFGLVLLSLLQVLPLPPSVLEVISPGSAAAWAAQAEAAGQALGPRTISLDPHGTWSDVTTLLAGGLLVVIGAAIFRRRASFRRLLAAIVVAGAAVVAIGLAQVASGASNVYWYFESPGMATSGPFAMHSHYAEFLNIAVGCAIGLLLLRASERALGRPVEAHELFHLGHKPITVERLLAFFCVIAAIGVVLSTSRNGLMSMVVAAGVTAALLHGGRRVEGIGWTMVIGAGLALAALLTLGVDPIIRELEDTFAEPEDALSTRLALVRDTSSMVAAFPVFGAGLGAYWVAFPAFDTSLRSGTAEHAENQYMEVAAELGLLGILLALAFALIVGGGVIRKLLSSSSLSNVGLAAVAFGLTAIAFHSLTDFGLEIPAVGLTVALLCGAAIGRAQGRSSREARPRFAFAGVSLAVGVLMLIELPGALEAAEGYEQGRTAELIRTEIRRSGWQGSAEQHDALVAAATAAATADPGDVEYRFWAIQSRWNHAVALHRDFRLDAPPTTPESAPELRELAQEIVADLIGALELSPVHGPTWSMAGQVSRIWIDEPTSGESNAPISGDWVLRGRNLAPHDPNVRLAAAFELFRRDRTDDACAELRDAIEVGVSRRAVIDVLAAGVDRPDLARGIAEGDLDLMERLLATLRAGGDNAELVAGVEDEVRDLLEAACARSSAEPRHLARLAAIRRVEGDDEMAIALYRRLLVRDPYSRQRFNYAEILARRGEDRDARRELRDVLTYHPGHEAARSLLTELESPDRR